MITQLRAGGLLLQYFMQRVTFLLLLSFGLGLLAYTVACAAGQTPWLEMPLAFGGQIYEDAGNYVQVGLTALVIGMMFFLPTNARVMALETSHRNFQIRMKDVARAYSAAHRADREGVFTLSSEFDSVRERIAFLRDHPDLGDLEPSVLEVAAQMSHVSKELAQVYSDSNVQRARDFLTARQQEIADFSVRLEEAKVVANEIRQWHNRVEIEEDVAESQLARLCEELEQILPEIVPEPVAQAPLAPSEHPSGWVRDNDAAFVEERDDQRVVAMVTQRAAE